MKFSLALAALVAVSQSTYTGFNTLAGLADLNGNIAIGNRNSVSGSRDTVVGDLNNLYGIGLDVRGNRN